MSVNLEKSIVLTLEPFETRLFKWSLQEVDEAGERGREKYIPWNWSSMFEARELRYSDTMTSRRPTIRGERGEVAISEQRVIWAKLMPLEHTRYPRNTEYSMFGTDRPIGSFDLTIYELGEGETHAKCQAVGFPSFTIELDRETQEDHLGFQFAVDKARFEEYRRLIEQNATGQFWLSLQGVSGFYAEWTPDVATARIKVLVASEKDHVVDMPADCDIRPPRLGEINEAEMHAQNKLVLAKSIAGEVSKPLAADQDQDLMEPVHRKGSFDEHAAGEGRIIDALLRRSPDTIMRRQLSWITTLLVAIVVMLGLILFRL